MKDVAFDSDKSQSLFCLTCRCRLGMSSCLKLKQNMLLLAVMLMQQLTVKPTVTNGHGAVHLKSFEVFKCLKTLLYIAKNFKLNN